MHQYEIYPFKKNKESEMAIEKFESFFTHLNQIINLTETEKSTLLAKLKYRTYLKGQYIVQEGDIYKYQTFIVQGKVRTFCLDHEGNEHIVAFGIENWWVGDLCSFTNQLPADFNTECLDKTIVVQISYQDLENLYVDIPKLERYFRLVVQKAYGFMSKRIVRNHSMSAKERYLLFNKSYPEIVQRVPQYMIASYLGITKNSSVASENKSVMKLKVKLP